MIFIPFVLIIGFGLFQYFNQKSKIQALKDDGVAVKGIIIRNRENGGRDFDRLGGNFNSPTIKFITKEGKEIIGKPIIGFSSQYEITVPSEVEIFYDPDNPEKFCINLD